MYSYVPPSIYAIANVVNGHIYIGSAKNYARRWGKHRRELQLGIHHSVPLQRAYEKYGKDVFDYSVIEYVSDEDALLAREQVWIDFFRPYYNVSKVAGSPTKGMKFSVETRKKMSLAHKGKKRPPRTKEWCERISLAKKGKKFTQEQMERYKEYIAPARAKQAEAIRGKKWTQERINNWKASIARNKAERAKI